MIDRIKNLFTIISQRKIIFFAGIFILIIAFVLLVVLLLFRTDKITEHGTSLLPTPTAVPFSTTKIEIKDQQRVSLQNANDLHWLNNQELTYTFFDTNLKRRVLAKTNIAKETILLSDNKLKFSEVFWSKNNDLLIFDYGTPYASYIFKKGSLREFVQNSYAFSWSPEGNRVFYLSEEGGKIVPKVYSIETGIASVAPTPNSPTFQLTYWSPKGDVILTATVNQETGTASLGLLSVAAGTFSELSPQYILFPAWSPDGNIISYVSEGGIYLYTASSGERKIFETDSSPQFISYAWISTNELLIFDAEKEVGQFWLVSVDTNEKREVLSSLSFSTKQRVEMLSSPNQQLIAIAADKDGLWVIKKNLLAIPR